jgi:hypothetical protein
MQVQDLVLDRADGPSSPTASLSTAVDLLEGRVDVVASNEVCWGTRPALVTTLSHFLELEAELELLGSSHNAALMKDQVDALWIMLRPSSDLLALHVLPSVVCGPPDGAGEWWC